MAECFELADEPVGAVLDRVAAREPVGAELAEGDAVADDVVVGDQDVVAGGADRFRVAAAAADLPVVGGEVGVLAAGGGAAPTSTVAPSLSSRWKSRRLRLRSKPAYNIETGLLSIAPSRQAGACHWRGPSSWHSLHRRGL